MKTPLHFLFVLALFGCGPDIQAEGAEMTTRRTYVRDEFEDKAAAALARQKPGTPIVRTLPSLSGPWVGPGGNNYGYSVPFSTTSAVRQSILKGSYGEPKVRTISLWELYSTEAAAQNNWDVVAEINAGTGGTIQSFEVDWANGAQISLPFSSIEVVAKYSGVNASSLDPPSGLLLSAMVGEGSSYHVNPTRTKIVTDVGGTQTFVLAGQRSDNIIIPPFATSLRIISTNGSGGPYDASSYISFAGYPSDYFGGASETGKWFGDIDRFMQGIPIQPGSRSVSLYNGSGDTVIAWFQFILSL